MLAGHSPRLHALSMLRKEESSLQVDLRVHGVTQDGMCKDGEPITEMQNLVDRLKDGCREKSIIEDLKQKGVSNVLSEESKRKLEGTAKIDLYERSETVRTTQLSGRRHNLLRMRKMPDTLKNTKIKIRKESTSLQNVCTL